MPTPLVELFLDAVKVDAVSLHEAPMARFVRERLRGLPVRVIEDGTAAQVNGDAGNVLCVPDGFDPGRPAIALFSHLDTPRSTADVRPQLSATSITSDGTTPLGVDNRAGCSILLHTLTEELLAGTCGNAIVVFTIGEEIGMYGAKHADLRPYNVQFCFVFDCSRRPGVFIQSAVGSSLYKAHFIGKSSHAGVAPEKGINAIHMAARALSQIPVGRLSPTMTANIGMITGGEATNIVPERCSVEGEVREFDQRLIDDHLGTLSESFSRVSRECGGTVEFTAQSDFSPFVLDPSSAAFRLATEVLTSVGLRPEPITYLGGSDANMLNAKGHPAVNLGIGAQNPHGNDEFILLEDLQKSAEIAKTLLCWRLS